jgi:hypothetical protein
LLWKPSKRWCKVGSVYRDALNFSNFCCVSYPFNTWLIYITGKFRHLPVVENGEVLALLDIAKCLHDATARMERAAEKGKAIAAAVEGVEKHWGSSNLGMQSISIFMLSSSFLMMASLKHCTVVKPTVSNS